MARLLFWAACWKSILFHTTCARGNLSHRKGSVNCCDNDKSEVGEMPRKISGFRAENVHEQLQNHLQRVLIRQGAQTNPQLIH